MLSLGLWAHPSAEGAHAVRRLKIGRPSQNSVRKATSVVANIPERQGVTGHDVRYVLFLDIIGFARLLISYFT
jgi:hypothetical protein